MQALCLELFKHDIDWPERVSRLQRNEAQGTQTFGRDFQGSFGSGKRGLLEKGSFQESPFSRDSRELRDARESPDCVKQRRIRPFSRGSREFRDSGDSSSEKTPFVMTPFFGPGSLPGTSWGCPKSLRKKKGQSSNFWPLEMLEILESPPKKNGGRLRARAFSEYACSRSKEVSLDSGVAHKPCLW